MNVYYNESPVRNTIRWNAKGTVLFQLTGFCMDVLNKIYEMRKTRQWTEYSLAKRADLPQSTISSWYNKSMTPSISSLEKICKAFGITMSQFFASESERIELTKEQKEMLEKWNVLNPEQKKALLQFLRNC